MNSLLSGTTIASFVSLLLPLVSIIVCLAAVWRVEKNLDVFLKFIVAALVCLVIRNVCLLFNIRMNGYFEEIYFVCEIAAGILVLVGSIVLLRSVKKLDNEG
jgi:zinc transporter ZupT